MAIPQAVLAAGWVPFIVVLFLTIVFSFLYIRYFQSKYDKELCSTLASMLALVVALLTCAIVPVDIFLVSYMKTSDGHFKDWAQNKEDRDSMVNGVLYAYYALYCAVMLFVFFILPFAYFFYEEGEEDGSTSNKARCCSAMKYTVVCVLFAVVLVLVGAFTPWRVANSSHNETDSDWEKIKNIFHDLGTSRGEDALSFCISILTMLGYLSVIVYTAYGMSAWPMDLVKGRRSVSQEREEMEGSLADTQAQIQAINNKYRGGRRSRMSRRDERRLQELEETEDLMLRRVRHLKMAQGSCGRRCLKVLRPLEIILGLTFFLLAVLVFLSLLLTNIDKILHSLGPKMGYALTHRQLPNPLDIVLVFSQKVFPLDYILMTGLVLYFVFCSMGGISHIGIWFCCIRMYKIRPYRTKPQGLLFLVFLLSFIVLALNVLFYQIAPQYTMYGSQHYWQNTTANHTGLQDGIFMESVKLVPCNTQAPPDECIMTRMTMLITRFCYKIWFFGAAYFWMSWAFIGMFVLGFVVALIRRRRSHVEGSVDRDDIVDSDEELVDA